MKLATKIILSRVFNQKDKEERLIYGNERFKNAFCHWVKSGLWVNELSASELKTDELGNLIFLAPEVPASNLVHKEYSYDDEDVYDARYRYLTIKNIRKFPETKYPPGYPYGLNFTQDNKPASLVLVGANGTGKTSLFVGMEYTMTGDINAARLRNVSNLKQFLTYGKTPYEQAQVEIGMINEYIKKDERQDSLARFKDFLPCFFCSENDLISLGKSTEQELFRYIVSQSGFTEIDQLIECLIKKQNEYSKYANKGKILAQYDQDITTKSNELEEKELIFKEKLYLTQKGKKLNKKAYIVLLNSLQTNFVNTPLPEPQPESSTDDKFELLLQYDKRAQQILDHYHILISDGDSDKINSAESETLRTSQEAEKIKQLKGYLKIFRGSSFLNDLKKNINHLELIAMESQIRTNIELSIASYRKFDMVQKVILINDVIESLINFLNSEQGISNFQDKLYKDAHDIYKLRTELETINSTKNQLEKKELGISYQQTESMARLLKPLIADLKHFYYLYLIKMKQLYVPSIIEILNYFSRNEDEKYSLNIDPIQQKFEITIHYKDLNNKIVDTTPKEYFNSFRYKLFTMSLKVAIALSAMKINRVNHPIIFDDIFYASDFENRIHIEEFIHNLFTTYNDLIKQEDPCMEGLQIILLSHDEMILDAVRGGINMLEKPVPAIYGRLYDYQEMCEHQTIRCIDGAKFYNLYLKI